MQCVHYKIRINSFIMIRLKILKTNSIIVDLLHVTIYLNSGTGNACAGHNATILSPIFTYLMSIVRLLKRGPTAPDGSVKKPL